MNNHTGTGQNRIIPIRLHLELKHDYLSEHDKRMLKRYGESINGDSITRDIFIPSDMLLHNLHYAIQKLFGWQNYHLRRFYLPDGIYKELTGGTVKGWADLVGILFQPPSETEKSLFWDDDYAGGSFSAWLKKKYTGPYRYEGMMEDLDVARADIKNLLKVCGIVDVREPFSEYMKRSKQDENTGVRIIKKAPLIDLTLDEMHASIMLEGGTENLLERLEVDRVLASLGEDLHFDGLFPVTRELIYNYDFGDDWTIHIRKYDDCDDLLAGNWVDSDELEEAKEMVVSNHKPVCIYKAGMSVLEDVGNLSGFAEFLGKVYESEDKSEASKNRIWARSLGWRADKIACKKML